MNGPPGAGGRRALSRSRRASQGHSGFPRTPGDGETGIGRGLRGKHRFCCCRSRQWGKEGTSCLGVCRLRTWTPRGASPGTGWRWRRTPSGGLRRPRPLHPSPPVRAPSLCGRARLVRTLAPGLHVVAASRWGDGPGRVQQPTELGHLLPDSSPAAALRPSASGAWGGDQGQQLLATRGAARSGVATAASASRPLPACAQPAMDALTAGPAATRPGDRAPQTSRPPQAALRGRGQAPAAADVRDLAEPGAQTPARPDLSQDGTSERDANDVTVTSEKKAGRGEASDYPACGTSLALGRKHSGKSPTAKGVTRENGRNSQSTDR